MKIRSLLVAASLSLVSPSVFAEDTAKQPAPTKPADKPTTTKAAKLTDAELKIVAHVHHVNVMEIDLGKRAQKQGTAAVKRYGEMLVRDHMTADKELVAFAKKRGIAKIPADKPENEADQAEMKTMKEDMAKLKALKGADFDRAYLQMMVAGHEKELAKTDPALAIVTDADLKTMLESRKTTLTKHADQARELQKGNAQASTEPAKDAPTKVATPTK